MHACEKLLLHYTVSRLKCMVNTWPTLTILKIITMGRDGPYDCFGGVLSCHIFIVVYLQFVEGRHLHNSTVFNWVWSFSISKDSGHKGLSTCHLATLHATATAPTISNHCSRYMPNCWWDTLNRPWVGNIIHMDLIWKMCTHWSVPQDLMQQHWQQWTAINCWPSTMKTSQMVHKNSNCIIAHQTEGAGNATQTPWKSTCSIQGLFAASWPQVVIPRQMKRVSRREGKNP